MPRGGARPGAGRPRKGESASDIKARDKDVVRAAKVLELTPLQYMLGVMNDPSQEDARRDRMAQAAAPFVHAKPGDAEKGKKEAAADAAKTAGQGTGWGDDLRVTH